MKPQIWNVFAGHLFGWLFKIIKTMCSTPNTKMCGSKLRAHLHWFIADWSRKKKIYCWLDKMPSTSTNRFASNKQSLAEDNHRIPSTSYPISFTTTYWGRVGWQLDLDLDLATRWKGRIVEQPWGGRGEKKQREGAPWLGRSDEGDGATERRGRWGNGAAKATDGRMRRGGRRRSQP